MIILLEGKEMIKSMTGFGRGVGVSEALTITLDLKSVNNKYLDIQVKMPGYLYPYEDTIKTAIKKIIGRGRIDVYVKDEKCATAKSAISVDRQLARKMYDVLDEMRSELAIVDPINLSHILLNNEILEFKPAKLDEEIIRSTLQTAVESAVEAAMVMKMREGELLFGDLSRILDELLEIILRIEQRAPLMVEEYRERLKARIQNLVTDLSDYDQDKIHSEVVFYAERSDINEEIVRFQSHLRQFRETMSTGGPSGKKLDFIAQELHREISTISAKSNDSQITEDVIEVKSRIDKLKEQVQNIE